MAFPRKHRQADRETLTRRSGNCSGKSPWHLTGSISRRLSGSQPRTFTPPVPIWTRICPLLRGREDHLIITLGSGSITDLVKHALYSQQIPAPFITIPTALTVTAFTSAFAILDFSGAKRTLLSRPVTATFWVEPFLESAPARMSRAGYGDLLARFIAYGDWLIGYRLGVMDRYDEGPYRLMEPFVPGIKANAPGFMVHPPAL